MAVYARDSGLTGADLAKAKADGAAFADLAEGGHVSPGIPSDGKAWLITLLFKGNEDEQDAAIVEISTRLASGTPAGLKTALTGTAGAACWPQPLQSTSDPGPGGPAGLPGVLTSLVDIASLLL